MEKITFNELKVKWNDLCEKRFAPLRIKEESDFSGISKKEVKKLVQKSKKNWKEIFEKTNSSKYKLFLQLINEEWGNILIQSGWTRLEEIEALSEWSVTSRIMYSQLQHGDKN